VSESDTIATEPKPWTVERARVASLTRSRTANDPALLAARERLAFARVEERVRRAVDAAPPLPATVERRLVELIAAHRAEVDAALARAGLGEATRSTLDGAA
jgi:hypothetical protein